MDSVASLCDVDTVAGHFDKYISQACESTFRQKSRKHKANKEGPAWYDAECRHKRAIAIQAGERVLSDKDREQQTVACRQYRTCKQRKNGCILGNVLRKLNPHISMTVAACGEC